MKISSMVTLTIPNLRVVPSDTPKFIIGNDVVRSDSNPSFRGKIIDGGKW